MSHHYVYPFLALADERPVVLYDQLDTGNADRPGDPANWRIERFVDEIVRLRASLDLDRLVLAGNSWGSIVALESSLSGVEGIVGLVLSGPVISVRRWSADAAELVAELPEEMQLVVARSIESGVFDSPEFEAATREYNRRHIMTSDPVPTWRASRSPHSSRAESTTTRVPPPVGTTRRFSRTASCPRTSSPACNSATGHAGNSVDAAPCATMRGAATDHKGARRQWREPTW